MHAVILDPRSAFRAGAIVAWAHRLAASLLAIVVAGLLSACGGGGDSAAAPQLPVITAQPTDKSVVEGNAASFAVTANGAAPLSYQWASSPDGATWSPIPGATDTGYSTGAATLALDGMRYRVSVGNSVGSVTSSAVHLTVTAAVVAPAIVAQPTSQTVNAPSAVTFSVTATGTSLSYRWQISGDGGASWADLVAPDAPSYQLAMTMTTQSGAQFRVVVGNSAGSVTSNAAMLTVDPTPVAPAFTTQPVAQTIVAGASVVFSATANGTPTPQIQWRANGTNLVDGSAVSTTCGSLVTGAGSPSLLLFPVVLGCDGLVFDAVATNGVAPPAQSTPALLTVIAAPAPPIITAQPMDVTVSGAGPWDVSFFVGGNGAPTPTAQWQTSTDGGVTWTNIVGATSSSYATTIASAASSGRKFRAIFTNASGSATSNAATFTVTGSIATLSLLAGDPLVSGSVDGSVFAAPHFRSPLGLSVDAMGNIYVADYENSAIRQISTTGIVTIAGRAAAPGSNDGPGNVARFDHAAGVVSDSGGTLYVTDTNNATIRVVQPLGSAVTTLAGTTGQLGTLDGTGAAARLNHPVSPALDALGNLYFADQFSHTIRKIAPGGVVTTLAGAGGSAGYLDATGPMARFNQPTGVATDATGNVYVVDYANHVIRKITPTGDVTTLAGTAGQPGSADGTGAAARFRNPQGMTADAAGNLYVTDTGNSIVRKITPAGAVTTVVGVAGQHVLHLGINGTIANPVGIVVVGNNRLAITSGHAVLTADLP
jgi:streptogramin lyase